MNTKTGLVGLGLGVVDKYCGLVKLDGLNGLCVGFTGFLVGLAVVEVVCVVLGASVDSTLASVTVLLSPDTVWNVDSLIGTSVTSVAIDGFVLCALVVVSIVTAVVSLKSLTLVVNVASLLSSTLSVLS